MRQRLQKKDQLHSSGKIMRTTRVSRALHDIFDTTHQPLSVTELLEQLVRRGIQANKTTIYRQLTALCKKRVVKEIPIAGHALHYELAAAKEHHHHLICVGCHRKQDIHINEDFERHERSIKKKHQFAVTHHSLEFYGYCKQCQ